MGSLGRGKTGGWGSPDKQKRGDAFALLESQRRRLIVAMHHEIGQMLEDLVRRRVVIQVLADDIEGRRLMLRSSKTIIQLPSLSLTQRPP